MNNSIKKTLKILISFGILIIIFSKINTKELLDNVLSTNILLFSTALLLSVFRVIIAAYRWKILLQCKKFYLSIIKLFNYYLISAFYNLILPTVLGGDVVRVMMLKNDIKSKSESFLSIFIERYIGFFALSFIALVSLFIGAELIDNDYVKGFVIFLFIAFVVVFLSIFNYKLATFLFNIVGKAGFTKIKKILENIYAKFYEYKQAPKILFSCFIISIIYQLLGILTTYLIGISINIQCPLIHYFVYVPLIWVVMMLPISISGIGVREGAFVYFFSISNVSKESALLLSILFFSQTIIVGLIGGMINIKYAFKINNKKLSSG